MELQATFSDLNYSINKCAINFNEFLWNNRFQQNEGWEIAKKLSIFQTLWYVYTFHSKRKKLWMIQTESGLQAYNKKNEISKSKQTSEAIAHDSIAHNKCTFYMYQQASHF